MFDWRSLQVVSPARRDCRCTKEDHAECSLLLLVTHWLLSCLWSNQCCYQDKRHPKAGEFASVSSYVSQF